MKVGGVLGNRGDVPHPPTPAQPSLCHLQLSWWRLGNRPTFPVCHLHSHCLLVTISRRDEERCSRRHYRRSRDAREKHFE